MNIILAIYPNGIEIPWYCGKLELEDIMSASEPRDNKGNWGNIYRWRVIEISGDRTKVWIEKVE